jgi:hypothetical protein
LEYALRRLIFLLLMLVGVASAQVVPGILRHASYEAPPDEGSWSYVALGAGTCTSVSDVAGTLSITAAGVDADNSCFVYQTIPAQASRLGAQVYGQIFSITGDAAATTLTGSMIRNSVAQNAAYCVAWWNANQTKVKGAVRPADGAALGGGIDGNAVALPAHTGVSFVDSTNKCKLYDNSASTTPANSLTDFAGVPQPHQSYDADMADNFLAGFIVRSGHATNTAIVTIKDYDVGDNVNLVDNGADPDQFLIFRSDFESGAIQAVNTNPDGWNRQTMDAVCDDAGIACPDPRDPPRCYRTQSCPATHSYSDTVVTSDNGVTPRAGNFMARLEVRDKDCPIGEDPCVTTAERSQLKQGSTTSFHMPYDTTCWVGWSSYMPSTEFSPNYTTYNMQLDLYPDPSTQIHMVQFTYRPKNAGDTTPTSMRLQCYVHTDESNGSQCATSSTGVGYDNPIDVHLDEWMDWRIEVKMNQTSGAVLKLWSRRAEVTDSFTLQANYTGGQLGLAGKTLVLNTQVYGGGGFPLVEYFDEYRVTCDGTGTMTDVDAPPIAP